MHACQEEAAGGPVCSSNAAAAAAGKEVVTLRRRLLAGGLRGAVPPAGQDHPQGRRPPSLAAIHATTTPASHGLTGDEQNDLRGEGKEGEARQPA